MLLRQVNHSDPFMKNPQFINKTYLWKFIVLKNKLEKVNKDCLQYKICSDTQSCSTQMPNDIPKETNVQREENSRKPGEGLVSRAEIQNVKVLLGKREQTQKKQIYSRGPSQTSDMKMIHKAGNTYKGVKIIVYFITTMNSLQLKVIKNVSGWLLEAEHEGWAKWM